MKRGLGGMFIIIIVLLGTLAWVYQNSVRESQLVAREAAVNEIRSNRLAVTRLVIERTYPKIQPESKAVWAQHLRDELGKKYGLDIAVQLDTIPPLASVEDRTYGMSSVFYLSGS